MGSFGFDWASAAISGGTSLLGGIFGAAQANANRKFQAREAQKQRDFNHAEAQLARNYNTAMVESQNRYNLPSAMARRYADAGMNPALVMSGGNLGSVGIGSSRVASSSASPSGASSDFNGISRSGLAAMEAMQISSQTANTNANTRLADAEAEGKEIENRNAQRKYDDQHSAIVQSMMESFAREQLSRTERDKVRKEIDEIGSRIDNLVVEGKILNENLISARADSFIDMVTIPEQVQIIASKCDLSVEEAKYCAKRLRSLIAYQNSVARVQNAAAKGQELSNDILDQVKESKIKLQKTQNEWDESFVPWRKFLDFGLDILDGAQSIMSIRNWIVGSQFGESSDDSETYDEHVTNFDSEGNITSSQSRHKSHGKSHKKGGFKK